MKVLAVDPLPEFRVQLTFADGTEGVVDLSDLAGRGVFQAWLQSGIFEQVRITEDGALGWPGDLDLCPDTLYLKVTGKQPGDIFPALDPSLAYA